MKSLSSGLVRCLASGGSHQRAYLVHVYACVRALSSSCCFGQVSGAKVASFDAHKLDGGALSDASILTLQYEGPPGKMNSLVLKYAKELDLGRELAVQAGVYEKECNFFEFLAPKAPIRVPEVYGVWRDEVNPETWFLIAMEDLSVENEVLPGAPGLDRWPTLPVPRAQLLCVRTRCWCGGGRLH